MTRLETLRARLSRKEQELESLEQLKKQCIASGGVTEWETNEGDHSSRVRSISLAEISTLIRKTEKDIDELSSAIDSIAGRGSANAFYIRGAW